MRIALLGTALALTACDSPSTSSGSPNTCGDAWVAFCDAMFDCLPRQQQSFSYDAFRPFDREHCIAMVLESATDIAEGVIGCDDPDELGFATCYAAAARISCDVQRETPDFDSVRTAVETCQR